MANCLTSWTRRGSHYHNAPVSKTKAATGMHTDSSDARYNPDLVCFALPAAWVAGRTVSTGQCCGVVGPPSQKSTRRLKPSPESLGPGMWSPPGWRTGLPLRPMPSLSLPRMSTAWCSATCGFGQNAPWTNWGSLCPPGPDPLVRFHRRRHGRKCPEVQPQAGRHAAGNNRTMVHGREAFEDLPGCCPPVPGARLGGRIFGFSAQSFALAGLKPEL